MLDSKTIDVSSAKIMGTHDAGVSANVKGYYLGPEKRTGQFNQEDVYGNDRDWSIFLLICTYARERFRLVNVLAIG